MPTTKKATAAVLTRKNKRDVFSIRGQRIVLEELPIDKYDDLVEKHTTRTEDRQGEVTETFDNAAFIRELVIKCLKEPTYAELIKGTRVIRTLEQRARDLNIGDEPVTLLKDEDEEAGSEDEGEAVA